MSKVPARRSNPPPPSVFTKSAWGRQDFSWEPAELAHPPLAPSPTPSFSPPPVGAIDLSRTHSVVSKCASSFSPAASVQSLSPAEEASYFETSNLVNQHCDRFWFTDGNMIIELGDTLGDAHYKLHRSVLEAQSPSFCTKSVRQLTDGYYLLLPNTLNVDFELLLSFIYPSTFGPDFHCSTDEWLRVLDVSTNLGFPALRRAALNALAPVHDAVARIRLARAHGVDEWLTGAYHELCKRAEPLDLEEARELGLEDMVRLARARETLLRGGAWAEVEDLFALPDTKDDDIPGSI